MKLKITQLIKICKSFYKVNSYKIEDIILFGSLVRGKYKPNDIDILLLFVSEIDKDVEYELHKKLPEKVSITSKTKEGYIKDSFDAREGILFEGFSLIHSKSISSNYGFSSQGLFIYNTKDFSNSKKTRFYYALNGRGNSLGMIEKLKAIKLSNNLILVSLEKIELAKDFFDYWEINYKFVPFLIPSRLAKRQLLSKVSLSN